MIELKNITKSYGKKIIFEKLSLSIGEGEFVAITGESGCGKSTLLNIIGLLETYDRGELIIDGASGIRPGSRQANKALREKISYLFQNFALVDDETVGYNLNLALKYSKGNKVEKMREALKIVGLEGFENKKIYKLSGGEQQRVAVARIILKSSKIILADEPTGSLDERNSAIIVSLLKALHKSGKTIVIVTHDHTVANQCQRIVALTRD